MRPPLAILCGGRGTRLREKTASLPKALVEIGSKPILAHVIDLYVSQGFDRILLATGYLGEMVEAYVSTADWPDGVTVECVDTGLDTLTGGRIRRLAGRLGDGTACVTYADGLADIDLGELLDHHRAQGRAATMTVVQPRLQWGVAEIAADGRVTGFTEKPRTSRWVNGGFFCFEPAALERMGPDSVLERAPLEGLARDGELAAYRHRGFWECMDTYKDAVALNDLWQAGEAPWLRATAPARG